MDVQCSSGSTSLAKKIRSLKLRSAVTSHRKLTTTIWEAHWSWSLKTTREVAQELIVNYSTVVWHLKQILKVKKLDTRVPHELLQIKKNCRFEVLLLFYATTTISQLDCEVQWKVDFMWQPGMTSSELDREDTPKHFPKPNLHPKKGHGHCLVVCCRSDPLQPSESQWNCYIW